MPEGPAGARQGSRISAAGALFLLLVAVVAAHGPRYRFGNQSLTSGLNGLCVGRGLEFFSASHADHVRGVWALAGPADLKLAFRCGSRSRPSRLVGGHHVAEQWSLVAVRCLFAVCLARHRRRVGPSRQPRPVDPKSCYACWMVMPRLARNLERAKGGREALTLRRC
jgi:hypothetical protein